jgi:hypothetical protein
MNDQDAVGATGADVAAGGQRRLLLRGQILTAV